MVHTDEFHPMDCTDIVIGSARGALGRVGDFYTRDRSTPRPDHFYGGTDSLTAAHASEINGLTTVIFRRPRSSESLYTLLVISFTDVAQRLLANK